MAIGERPSALTKLGIDSDERNEALKKSISLIKQSEEFIVEDRHYSHLAPRAIENFFGVSHLRARGAVVTQIGDFSREQKNNFHSIYLGDLNRFARTSLYDPYEGVQSREQLDRLVRRYGNTLLSACVLEFGITDLTTLRQARKDPIAFIEAEATVEEGRDEVLEVITEPIKVALGLAA